MREDKELDRFKVVILRSFNSINEANVCSALLESAGIGVQLQNDLAAQVIPLCGQIMQINILVLEQDFERATQILDADFDQAEVEWAEGNENEEVD